MTTTVVPLSDEDREFLESRLQGVHLDGECYALALALHAGLGWPVVGLMMEQDGRLIPRHAGVRCPDGRMLDARGALDEETFGSHFLSPPFVLMELPAIALHEIRPIDENSIAHARQIAETLWPELPWKDRLSDRVVAFVDALEQLCRTHGFWLREPYPTARPVLYPSGGDEEGFAVTRLPASTQFALSRVL